MDILCNFKIKIESQNLDHGCVKDKWPYSNQDQDSKTKSGASSILKWQKIGFEGHRCSLHLQNHDAETQSEYGCIKDKWQYPNYDQDAKPKSGTSTIIKSPKWGFKGHGFSLHLVRNLQCLPMPQIRTLRTWIFFAPSKSRQRAKVQNMGVANTSENIQIKIKMTNLI